MSAKRSWPEPVISEEAADPWGGAPGGRRWARVLCGGERADRPGWLSSPPCSSATPGAKISRTGSSGP
jgi:hypothetical protein